MAVSLGLTITQGTQQIDNNRTYITVAVTAYSSGGSWNAVTNECKVTVSGAISGSWYHAFSANTSTALGSTSGWVTHNADGTRSITINASYTTGVSAGTVYASGSKTLTTIPRKSGVSVSPTSVDADGTTSVTITLDKKSSSFTDTVTVELGEEKISYDLGTSTTSKTLTIPLEWNNQIPNSNSGVATITTTTKNGNTTLGSSSASLTVNVPQTAALNPALSFTTSDSNGHASVFGKYLVGQSRITVTGTETGQYGATIKSRTITVNGETYTANPSTSNVLSSVGNTSVSYSITDSRGRTTVKTSTIQTYDYTPPKITSYIAPVRWSNNLSSGTEKNNGDYAKVSFSFEIDTGLSGNALSIAKVISKEADSAEINTTTTSGETKYISAVHTKTVDITYYVQDKVGQVAKMSFTLPTAEAILSSRKGYQLAVGKIAERGTSSLPVFEVGWNMYLHKTSEFHADADFYSASNFYGDIFVDDDELEALYQDLE